MGNKTIYVTNDAEPIFEEAKALAGGNLSSVITSSLSDYVKREKLLKDGYDEISITVGEKESPREIRFMGKHLLNRDDETKGYKVYITPKEQIAIVVYPLLQEDDIFCGPYEEHDNEAMEVRKELQSRYREGDYLAMGVYEPLANPSLIVKPSVEGLFLEVPDRLLDQIESARLAKANPIEYLDI